MHARLGAARTRITPSTRRRPWASAPAARAAPCVLTRPVISAAPVGSGLPKQGSGKVDAALHGLDVISAVLRSNHLRSAIGEENQPTVGSKELTTLEEAGAAAVFPATINKLTQSEYRATLSQPWIRPFLLYCESVLGAVHSDPFEKYSSVSAGTATTPASNPAEVLHDALAMLKLASLSPNTQSSRGLQHLLSVAGDKARGGGESQTSTDSAHVVHCARTLQTFNGALAGCETPGDYELWFEKVFQFLQWDCTLIPASDVENGKPGAGGVQSVHKRVESRWRQAVRESLTLALTNVNYGKATEGTVSLVTRIPCLRYFLDNVPLAYVEDSMLTAIFTGKVRGMLLDERLGAALCKLYVVAFERCSVAGGPIYRNIGNHLFRLQVFASNLNILSDLRQAPMNQESSITPDGPPNDDPRWSLGMRLFAGALRLIGIRHQQQSGVADSYVVDIGAGMELLVKHLTDFMVFAFPLRSPEHFELLRRRAESVIAEFEAVATKSTSAGLRAFANGRFASLVARRLAESASTAFVTVYKCFVGVRPLVFELLGQQLAKDPLSFFDVVVAMLRRLDISGAPAGKKRSVAHHTVRWAVEFMADCGMHPLQVLPLREIVSRPSFKAAEPSRFTWVCGCGTTNVGETNRCYVCTMTKSATWCCPGCKAKCIDTTKVCESCGTTHPWSIALQTAKAWWCHTCAELLPQSVDCAKCGAVDPEKPVECPECQVLSPFGNAACDCCGVIRDGRHAPQVEGCDRCGDLRFAEPKHCSNCHRASRTSRNVGSETTKLKAAESVAGRGLLGNLQVHHFRWQCGCGSLNSPTANGCHRCSAAPAAAAAGEKTLDEAQQAACIYTCTGCKKQQDVRGAAVEKNRAEALLRRCTHCCEPHPRYTALTTPRMWVCPCCQGTATGAECVGCGFHRAAAGNGIYLEMFAELPWTCHQCGHRNAEVCCDVCSACEADRISATLFNEYASWRCRQCHGVGPQRGFACSACGGLHNAVNSSVVHVWKCAACSLRSPSWVHRCPRCSSTGRASTEVYLPWSCVRCRKTLPPQVTTHCGLHRAPPVCPMCNEKHLQKQCRAAVVSAHLANVEQLLLGALANDDARKALEGIDVADPLTTAANAPTSTGTSVASGDDDRKPWDDPVGVVF